MNDALLARAYAARAADPRFGGGAVEVALGALSRATVARTVTCSFCNQAVAAALVKQMGSCCSPIYICLDCVVKTEDEARRQCGE